MSLRFLFRKNKENKRIAMVEWKSRKGFFTLGYGFVAYFSFMEYMIILFTLLTLLSLPSLYFYITFNKTGKNSSGFLNTFNMGNLGYASTICRDIHLGVGKLSLSWETGNMTDLVAFGLIPSDSNVQDACFPNSETEQCDEFIDKDKYAAYMKSHCIGKSNCMVDVNVFVEGEKDSKHKCINRYTRFYTQAFCKISSREGMKDRK